MYLISIQEISYEYRYPNKMKYTRNPKNPNFIDSNNKNLSKNLALQIMPKSLYALQGRHQHGKKNIGIWQLTI